MSNTRRGFLKTLGKLGAAVGITAAACSVPHQHPRHPKRSNEVDHKTFLEIMETPDKASPRTAPKAKWRYGFTGFKTTETKPLTYEALEETYQIASYTYMNHDRALRELDPYNWRGVWELEWKGWKARDPSRDTITGIWLATVRPYFASCFEKPSYYVSTSLSRHQLLVRKEDLKKHAKDLAYRRIVDELQDQILDRIKRDVKSRT